MMNFRKYQTSIAKKIRAETNMQVRYSGISFLIFPYRSYKNLSQCISFEEKEIIKNWIRNNTDIVEFMLEDSKGIEVSLVNYEKYENESIKEKATQYDKEIEELEQKLQELKKMQKIEIENNRKARKINNLKKQLKELEAK